MKSSYQVSEKIVLESDDYMKVALKRTGYKFNKIMDVLMEVDRLYEVEKFSAVRKSNDKLKANLYKVDKKVVDISTQYLLMALINRGVSVEKAFKIIKDLEFIYRNFDTDNMKFLADQVEPNEGAEMLNELIRCNYIDGEPVETEPSLNYRFLRLR